jgi:hypothetical protein
MVALDNDTRRGQPQKTKEKRKMMKDYTFEEMTDLIGEYSAIDMDAPIEFYIEDNAYILEYYVPFDYLSDKHTDYTCVAKVFEEYNEDTEEVETILTISASGLLLEDIQDGWEDRYVISSFTIDCD